jgi:hypothetical protein
LGAGATAKRTALARAPIPPWQDVLCFRGEEQPVKTAPFFARRREVLTGCSSPLTIANPGNGSGPRRSHAVSGSCGLPLLIGLNLPGTSACLSPRFYPHSTGPVSPLLDGVPRFGGALLSPLRPLWIKTQNAVGPIATVMLYFDASQCSFSLPRFPLSQGFVPLTPPRFSCPPRPSDYCAAAHRPPR